MTRENFKDRSSPVTVFETPFDTYLSRWTSGVQFLSFIPPSLDDPFPSGNLMRLLHNFYLRPISCLPSNPGVPLPYFIFFFALSTTLLDVRTSNVKTRTPGGPSLHGPYTETRVHGSTRQEPVLEDHESKTLSKVSLLVFINCSDVGN